MNRTEFEQRLGKVVAAYTEIAMTVLAVVESLDGRDQYARSFLVGASDRQKFDVLLRLAETHTDLTEEELVSLRRTLQAAEEARNRVVHSIYVYAAPQGAQTDAPDARIKERSSYRAGRDPFIAEPVDAAWFEEQFQVVHAARGAIGNFAIRLTNIAIEPGDSQPRPTTGEAE